MASRKTEADLLLTPLNKKSSVLASRIFDGLIDFDSIKCTIILRQECKKNGYDYGENLRISNAIDELDNYIAHR